MTALLKYFEMVATRTKPKATIEVLIIRPTNH